VVGYRKAASQVPSAVLISTLLSTTGSVTAEAKLRAARPAAMEEVTDSRRGMSLTSLFL
jgi:hypothetical protein